MLRAVPVAVLVSGGGTNLQALIDFERSGEGASYRIALVISDRPGVYALERAKAAGIPSLIIDRKALGWEGELLEALKRHGIELIALAGFLSILGERVIRAYPDRIVNVHPSLIPAFCGKGYYGLKVHQAAIDRGVKLTGATVHLVNEEPDGGPILAQKVVPVLPGDTPEALQRRVMREAEWILLPQAVERLAQGLLEEKR